MNQRCHHTKYILRAVVLLMGVVHFLLHPSHPIHAQRQTDRSSTGEADLTSSSSISISSTAPPPPSSTQPLPQPSLRIWSTNNTQCSGEPIESVSGEDLLLNACIAIPSLDRSVYITCTISERAYSVFIGTSCDGEAIAQAATAITGPPLDASCMERSVGITNETTFGSVRIDCIPKNGATMNMNAMRLSVLIFLLFIVHIVSATFI